MIHGVAQRGSAARTRGILVYPTVGKEYNLDHLYSDQWLLIRTVDINNTHWSVIDRRLKDIIEMV